MSRRGWVKHYTRDEIVARAMTAIIAVPRPPKGAPPDAGGRPSAYHLPYPNGGDDEDAVFSLVGDCGGAWAYGGRTSVKDCIGHALACLGIDRKQPGYEGVNGEWLNCKAIYTDAKGAHSYFMRVPDEDALPGDVMVDEDHIGVVVRPALSWWVDRDGDGKQDAGELMKLDILVSDCSPRHGRDTAVGLGTRWSQKCIIARPLFIADP